MWRERIRYRQSLTRSRKLVKLAKLSFFGVIGFFIFLLFVLPLLAFNLPSPDKIVRTQGFSTKILDRNGKLLYDVYANQNRNPIVITDVPVYLKEATIAIEDKNFYKHQGFDPFGMLRGFLRIFTQGRAEGGSTITQQLVKNVLLTNDRTIVRKIKEFVLAVQIEKKYSKDQILQMYLNEVPYGGTAWGVGSAAQIYFGKAVKDLDLIESAVLAGLPQSPSTYSPYSSTPKAYVQRTKDVLRRMQEDGYITKAQETSADATLPNVEFQVRGATFEAPHFVQYVQNILEKTYGQASVEQGGLTVTTTLDLDLQDLAQTAVTEEIAKVEKQHITNGAAIVIAPETGEILAMVGSKNFLATDYDGQVNVTTSLRQPGSSFKPFTYVTAFKKGFTPSTLLMDVPTTFPGGIGQPDYNPVNYDGKYRGPLQVRYALGNSINMAAVKMLAMIGIKDVLTTATDMGLTTLPPTTETLKRVGLSLTLGGGEVRLLDMADAYSAFVNKGFRVDPIAILKVTDLSGKVLEENKPQKGNRVLTEEAAFLIDSILSDNNARKDVFGLNSLLNVPDVMVKTGTTNDKRDNWTIGGNATAMVGVWVGNNDNSQMLNVASGVSGASPIWRRIISASLKGKPTVKFDVPAGINQQSVDTVSGYGAHDNFPSRTEYFIKGTEPALADPIHVLLKVCKTDGKLATPSDIAGNSFDYKEFFRFTENDPTAAPGGVNKWQEGINNWLGGQTDPKYHPPTDYCGTSNPLNVDFTKPHDQDSNIPVGKFTVAFSANSSSAITQVGLKLNGLDICMYNNGANNYNCEVNFPSIGVYTLKADAMDAANHVSYNPVAQIWHRNFPVTTLFLKVESAESTIGGR
ncbi:MAG: PBP1A family penicillin-binding protein [Candidatus Woesebacteria bacterium]|nr:PBP1A family penicillin-binding protein [Candidatus Woesebacteria bacterium]